MGAQRESSDVQIRTAPLRVTFAYRELPDEEVSGKVRTQLVTRMFAAYCMNIPADCLPELYSIQKYDRFGWYDEKTRTSHILWRIS
jgi:hypothetical protein